MEPSALKQWYREYVDLVFNRRDVDAAVARYWDPAFTNHWRRAEVPAGLQGVRQDLDEWFSAFPDARIDVEDVLVEGDQLVARLTIQATHAGEFMGIPATGARLLLREIAWYRLKHGRFLEVWPSLWDVGNVIAQVREAALRALGP